ncbi:hypothetical protein EMCG_02872 [[Emmonsia] crescens]|uniref:Uncharacterized protein n=1 Tax=[Emmonsia] crescens TaxID=73230 RepID=A0A0G2HWX6_9EURO|nr:hypothetical protein EMCG_02872 [Emmonsia crescens UAMH 3008]
MSALHQQCLSGQAATRRLASGNLGYGGTGVMISRSGLWIQSRSSSSSRLAVGTGGKSRNGHGYGYGFPHALQWRQNLSSDTRAKARTSAKCATWFIQKPGQVTPSDIISRLPTLTRSDDISHTVPVLLVTPAFASWVVKSHSFLSESMAHIFQNLQPNISGREDSVFYYSVAAVVDKLPAPGTASSLREGKECGDTLAGQHWCEGISLFLANRDALQAEVIKAIQKRDMSTPETEPTLSYMYHQQPTKPAGSPAAAATFTEVGVRLANTLFVNGKPRTMLASRWRYPYSHPNSSPTSPTSPTTTLTLDKEYNLVGCRIKCATEPHAVAGRVPLQPVTKPREIVTSMGNIISQLCKGDGSGATIPASAELEKALPAYLKENNMQNQSVAVWALVQSVGLSMAANGNDNDNANANANGKVNANASGGAPIDPLSAINNGARLHRVVSGGGGWGKKQGLLSLDPEHSYQIGDAASGSGQVRPVHEIFQETGSGSDVEYEHDPMPSLFDVPGSIQFKDGRLTTDLSEIAKRGDTVQFLVAPLDDNPQAAPTMTTTTTTEASVIDVDKKRTTQVSFGVIPSSDGSWTAVVEARTSDTEGDYVSPPGDSEILAVPDYFGALSEKGLVYSRFAEGDDIGGHPGQLVLGTKIDVPGSRITIESV